MRAGWHGIATWIGAFSPTPAPALGRGLGSGTVIIHDTTRRGPCLPLRPRAAAPPACVEPLTAGPVLCLR